VSWREREDEAALILRHCRAEFAARGSSPLAEATGGAEIADWRHFPEGDGYDPASHAQYFYHHHPETAEPAYARRGEPREFGHFHLFLRAAGMPPGLSPLLLPELAVANAPAARQSAPQKRGAHDEVCHLVAIALDSRGEPIRLFTTNRWVTGETWYGAEDVIRMLDRFRLHRDGGSSALLNCWLTALVRLFQPEISALLRRRDRTITEWRWRRRGNAFEDERLEITSVLDIDLEARLAAAAGDAPGAALAAGAGRPAQLPRMAEGWGR
jgi:hypothetical protein